VILILECFPVKIQYQKRALIILTLWTISLAAITQKRLYLFHSSQQIWKDVTIKQPLEPRGWTALSGIFLEEGKFDAAKAQIEIGFEHLPEHPALMQGYGLIYYKEGEFQQAEQWLQKAWQIDNSKRKAANNLAIVFQRTNRLTEAREISEQLVALHPVYATGWNTLGAIAIEQGDLQQAHTALIHSLSLNPYSTSTLANLGNLEYIAGDLDSARKWWRETLAIDPNHQHAKNGLNHLKTLEK
jgi:Flp pilus assembly protein TadD